MAGVAVSCEPDVKNAASVVEIAVTMSLRRPQNPNVVIATYLETAKVDGIVTDFPSTIYNLQEAHVVI